MWDTVIYILVHNVDTGLCDQTGISSNKHRAPSITLLLTGRANHKIYIPGEGQWLVNIVQLYSVPFIKKLSILQQEKNAALLQGITTPN